MRKDPRRWATFKVPDEARQTVQQAMWIAERMTASPVEAWESIAQEYLAANLPAFYEQCRRAKDEEAIFRLTVLCRDEWRCKMCGTSRNLQTHHILYEQDPQGATFPMPRGGARGLADGPRKRRGALRPLPSRNNQGPPRPRGAG